MLAGIGRTLRYRGLTGTARLAYNMSMWNALRLTGRRYATVPIHEFRMRLELRDPGLSRQLFVYRDRERALGRVLRELICEGMQVLDVGGNLGYYPVMEASLVGPSGRVHVMEPVPANFRLLQRNVVLNGFQDRVSLYPCAAHELPTKKILHLSHASNLGTMVPASSDKAEQRYLTGEEIEVDTVDLSSFIEPLGSIDLIRMDPEGAEVAILKGLITAIRRGIFRGRIITEVHPAQYSIDANDIKPVLAELFALGYRVEIVTSVTESDSYLQRYGYRPLQRVRESNRVVRGIYREVQAGHLLEAVCRIGAVRDLVLAKQEEGRRPCQDRRAQRPQQAEEPCVH